MKKKNLIWAGIAVVVVAAAGYMMLGSGEASQGVHYVTAKLDRSNVAVTITATGKIKPVTEVEVGTQVSGIVDKLYADFGTPVKKGQLIAEMDRITLNSDLQSAQAQYNSAKADFEFQEKNFMRNKALHEKQLISDQDFEQSEYNYKTSKSQLDNSAASLTKSRRNLSYATITSPIDGIITNRNVEEGQTVAAGFETPELYTIAADLTQMEVIADVDEADIGGIEEGQKVTFTVDAYPDDVFEGKVSQIRMGSTTSSSTTTSTSTVVTYEVVISAPNDNLKLLPRLTANVTIYKSEHSNVLAVPTKALRFTPTRELVGNDAVIKDTKATRKLWTKEGNTFIAHAVETGIAGDGNTEILSGFEEGSEYILEAKLGSDVEDGDAESLSKKRESMFGPGGGPGGMH